MPNQSKLHTILRYVVVVLGLWLSFYILAKGDIGSQCPAQGNNCGNASSSPYAKILGLPVALYSSILWIICLGRSKRLFIIASACLIIGSAYFMTIMFFVIKALCPVCILHATFCFFLIPFLFKNQNENINKSAASIVVLPVALGLLIITAITRHHPNQLIPPLSKDSDSAFSDSFDDDIAFSINGVPADSSKKLLLSFSCDHCIQLLIDTLRLINTRDKETDSFTVPLIYFHSDPSTENITRVFTTYLESSSFSTEHAINMLSHAKQKNQKSIPISDISSFPQNDHSLSPGHTISIDDRIRKNRDAFSDFPISYFPQLRINGRVVSRFQPWDLLESSCSPMIALKEESFAFGNIEEDMEVKKSMAIINVGNTGAYLVDGTILNGAGHISFYPSYLRSGEAGTITLSLKNIPEHSLHGTFVEPISYHLPKDIILEIIISASFPKKGLLFDKHIYDFNPRGMNIVIEADRIVKIRDVSTSDSNIAASVLSFDNNTYTIQLKSINGRIQFPATNPISLSIETGDGQLISLPIHFYTTDFPLDSPIAHDTDLDVRSTNHHDLHPESHQDRPTGDNSIHLENEDSYNNSPLFHGRKENANTLIVSLSCQSCLTKILELIRYVEDHTDSSVPRIVWMPSSNGFPVDLLIHHMHSARFDPISFFEWIDSQQSKGFSQSEMASLFEVFFGKYIPSSSSISHLDRNSALAISYRGCSVPSLSSEATNPTPFFSIEDACGEPFRSPILLASPSITIAGAHSAGDTIRFDITVKNDGSDTANLIDTQLLGNENAWIRWEEKHLKPRMKTTAHVSWPVRNSTPGKHRISSFYENGNTGFKFDFSYQIPLMGWVWETIDNHIVEDMNEFEIQFSHVSKPEAEILAAHSDIQEIQIAILPSNKLGIKLHCDHDLSDCLKEGKHFFLVDEYGNQMVIPAPSIWSNR